MNGKPVRLMQTLGAFVLTVFLVGCSLSQYPSDVAKTLEAAGDNRVELEKVLAHYAAPEDSLKLQAAFFLIGNMEGHCYATYALRDTAGADIDFDVLDYVDFNALLAAADSIEEDRGEMDFERGDKTLDIETITSDFLIEQIDYAFRAWREKPWAQGFSFDEFRRYILPYRGSNEPLENWRRPLWKRYLDITDSMTDPTDPIEAATLINNDIKSWFGFDPRFYYHPTDQGLSEMLTNGLGRCEDMTNITIYAMRANGLAVTSDSPRTGPTPVTTTPGTLLSSPTAMSPRSWAPRPTRAITASLTSWPKFTASRSVRKETILFFWIRSRRKSHRGSAARAISMLPLTMSKCAMSRSLSPPKSRTRSISPTCVCSTPASGKQSIGDGSKAASPPLLTWAKS